MFEHAERLGREVLEDGTMEVGPAGERIALLSALRVRGQMLLDALVVAALDCVQRPVRFLALFTLDTRNLRVWVKDNNDWDVRSTRRGHTLCIEAR